jgi:hypothetical protein
VRGRDWRRSTTCRSSRPSTGWKQWPRNPSWRRLSASKPAALFIALPVLRVLVMLGAFILNQDYRLVIVATVVLMTILAGLVIGPPFSNPLAH